MPGTSLTYQAALANPMEAVKILGITKSTTVAKAADILFDQYKRVNGGSETSSVSRGRVEAAAHDLIERNYIEPWVAQACVTKVTT